MGKNKIKTSKSAAKRFKITGRGKIKFHRAGKSHLLSKKSQRRKRSLRKTGLVSGSDAKKIRRVLPNR